MAVWGLPYLSTRQVLTTRSGSGWGGSAVTPGATAHTKGSFVKLGTVAAAGPSANMIFINLNTVTNASAGAGGVLLDLWIAPIGTAVGSVTTSGFALVSDLQVGYRERLGQYMIPLRVPPNVDIFCRLQAATAAHAAITVGVDLHGGDPAEGVSEYDGIDVYGLNSAATQGVVLTANATANQAGAWTQLTASTPNDIAGVALGCGLANAATVTGWNFGVDIGMGASGSEQVISDRQHMGSTSTTEAILWQGYTNFWVPLHRPVEAGSRLSARLWASVASVATFDVIGYGFRG